MGCIIVVGLSAILLWGRIISADLYIAICILSMIWVYLGAGLYWWTGLFKFYYHNFLGWHKPDDSVQCKCRYCGKDIMQDSQGNWF